MRDKIKNIWRNFCAFLRESNVIGILQLTYISFFYFIGNILWLLNFNPVEIATITFIIYPFFTLFLYSNKDWILRYTNSTLVKVLNTIFFQTYILLCFSLELSILHFYSTSIVFGFVMGSLIYNFSDVSILQQQIIITLAFLFLFWIRFRSAFFNTSLVNELDIKYSAKVELIDNMSWETVILLFNSFFIRHHERLGLPKKSFYVQSRFGGDYSGAPKAFLGFMKHHPKKAVAITGCIGAYFLGQEGRLIVEGQQKIDLEAKLGQQKIVLEEQKIVLEGQKIALEHDRELVSTALKFREDGMEKARAFCVNASNTGDSELKRMAKKQLEESTKRYNELKSPLDVIDDPSFVKVSASITESSTKSPIVPSVFEAISFYLF